MSNLKVKKRGVIMEELCKGLNLVYDDDQVIGKVTDIVEVFYRLIKYEIDNIEDLEERTIGVAEKVDFISQLINEIGDNELNKNSVIKVKENPMAGFNYEVV